MYIAEHLTIHVCTGAITAQLSTCDAKPVVADKGTMIVLQIQRFHETVVKYVI